jgi:predicted nucleic acid-binding protein
VSNAPARGLLDTGVFIADESGRAVDAHALPAESAISAVTLAELRVGVLAAKDSVTRGRRLTTLQRVAALEVLVVDAAVADRWADLRLHLAQTARRLNVNDLWIAATALAHGLPIVTQDADFDPLDGVGGLEVVRV